jgi:hypothetical protein
MWLGVLYLDEDDRGAGDVDDLHVLQLYWPHKIFVAAGPLGGMANAAHVFRQASRETGLSALPRCPHCAANLGAPDVDAMERVCGSS